MSEKTEKFVAIGLGLALTGGIVAWKALSPPPEGEGAAGPSLTATVISEQEAPEGFRTELFYSLASVDGLPAQKLAQLKLEDEKAELEKMRSSGEDTGPVRKKELKLGANTCVFGPVQDVPGQAGRGTMTADLYLVHAGPFPGAEAGGKHRLVCLLYVVDPEGDGYKGGLRVGDIWVSAAGTEVLTNPPADPCKALGAASAAVAPGSELPVVVIRQGARTELPLHKGSALLNIKAMSVPVLDADKT